MSDTLELLSKSLTVKKTRILRRRNNRMKIQFNLTKEQGEAFSQFKDAVNVNQLSEEDFAKTAFMIGLKQMEKNIIAKMQEEKKSQANQEGEAPEIVEDEPEIVEDGTEETEK